MPEPKPIPNPFPPRNGDGAKEFTVAIVDLETMGTDPDQHEIIEIGILSFVCSTKQGFLYEKESLNQLADPGKPIPEEITKVTGITQDDVRGKSIDWGAVRASLADVDLVICHNAAFDRKFLESQTPGEVQKLIRHKPFACTLDDIDWHARGHKSRKLGDLNEDLGYTYEAHRAINDCRATLNLLMSADGAFRELMKNSRKTTLMLCATYTPFEKKDELKANGFHWSDGRHELPKGWVKRVAEDRYHDTLAWLDREIYRDYPLEKASRWIPRWDCDAEDRYSVREERLYAPPEGASRLFQAQKAYRKRKAEEARTEEDQAGKTAAVVANPFSLFQDVSQGKKRKLNEVVDVEPSIGLSS